MAEPAQRAATYEDLLAVPENLVAEILFGHLVTHPRPAPRHSVAIMALGASLAPAFQFARPGRSAWIFMNMPEVHLGPHVVVPDAAAWRRLRLTVLPETSGLDVVPDWVCEVHSPGRDAPEERRAVYAKAGVPYLWHVDPVLRMLEVFELRGGKWLLLDVYRDNAAVAAPPFADVSFPLGLLWPFDPPAEGQA
jgi:Uma2 family endonuclease